MPIRPEINYLDPKSHDAFGMTEEQYRDTCFDWFKVWIYAREEAGGPMNPLFFSTDINALSQIPESEIAILQFRPVPGAMGTQLSALGEWRTYTGKAVELVGVVPPGEAKSAAVQGKKWYHGTKCSFDAFDHEGRGTIHFTSDPRFAGMYSGGMKWNEKTKKPVVDRSKKDLPTGANIMPCYLKCDQLFDFRDRNCLYDAEEYFNSGEMDQWDFNRACADYYEVMEEELTDEQKESYDADCFVKQVQNGSWVALELGSFIGFIRERGYDGIVMIECGVINYAVFDPNQVKSATGNQGDFDPENANITAAARRKLPPFDEVHYWYYPDRDSYGVVGFLDGDGMFSETVPMTRLVERYGQRLAERMIRHEGEVFHAPGTVGELSPPKRLLVHETELSDTDRKLLGEMHITGGKCVSKQRWDEMPEEEKDPAIAAPYLREEEWKPGEQAWFEYHCTEAHDSADADLWYRSHQRVTVVGREQADGWDWPGSTMRERGEAGAPRAYKVRFKDGYERTAGEDELMTSRKGFYRPDPPKGKFAVVSLRQALEALRPDFVRVAQQVYESGPEHPWQGICYYIASAILEVALSSNPKWGGEVVHGEGEEYHSWAVICDRKNCFKVDIPFTKYERLVPREERAGNVAYDYDMPWSFESLLDVEFTPDDIQISPALRPKFASSGKQPSNPPKGKTASKVDKPLYHVTYSSHVPGILKEGIRPDRAGEGNFPFEEAANKVFLTSAEGVDFWSSLFQEMINGGGLREEVAVLEVSPEGLDLAPDEEGENDAGAPAYWTWFVPAENIVVHGPAKQASTEDDTLPPKPGESPYRPEPSGCSTTPTPRTSRPSGNRACSSPRHVGTT